MKLAFFANTISYRTVFRETDKRYKIGTFSKYAEWMIYYNSLDQSYISYQYAKNRETATFFSCLLRKQSYYNSPVAHKCARLGNARPGIWRQTKVIEMGVRRRVNPMFHYYALYCALFNTFFCFLSTKIALLSFYLPCSLLEKISVSCFAKKHLLPI